MSIFFIYSLKVTLCLTAFYLVYKLLLSRDTFFAYNRFVLLGLCALSLSLPLAQVSTSNPSPIVAGFAVVETMVVSAEVYEPTSLDLSVTSLCFGVYLLGVLFFLAREIWSLLSLRRLISGGRIVENDGTMKVVVVKDHVSPFSWMGNVVMSEKDYADSPEYIIRHERAHVAAQHSWDILACDLLIVFQWYNPAAWLLKSELQAVHEYEADRSVLNSGINATDYQMFLIRKTAGEKLFSAANNLNQYSLKNRIAMMKKSKSNKWNHCKVLAVLPVAATALVAFASPKAESLTNEITRESDVLVSAVRQATSQEKGRTLEAWLSGSDGEARQGMERPATPQGDKDANAMPWQSTTVTAASDGEQEGGITIVTTGDNLAQAYYVVDGKHVTDISHIKADDIQSVTVLKGKHATDKYGEAAKGGAIEVMLKKSGEREGALSIVTTGGNLAQAYYVVDGKHVTDISHIKADDIQSVTVLKDKSATDKYGENGKNGVIEITMKKK